MEEKKYIFKKLYKKHFPKNKKTQDFVRACLVHGEINPDQHWDIVKLVDFFFLK